MSLIGTFIMAATDPASPYIAAGAAIVGALVGGRLTAGTTYFVEKNRREAENAVAEERENRMTRGLARVMYESQTNLRPF